MPLEICYHGTNEENALGILREGFKIGTYFARHLEDAIGYGGPHVFGVAFDTDRFSHSLPHWQFVLREVVLPSCIVHYRIYQVREMAVNQHLWEKILQSNLIMGQDYCDGEGQGYWDTEEDTPYCLAAYHV